MSGKACNCVPIRHHSARLWRKPRTLSTDEVHKCAYFGIAVKIDHSPWEESGRYFLGMNKKLSLKNILAVRCPAYIAGPRGLVKAVLVK
jgi:hypothetical protein